MEYLLLSSARWNKPNGTRRPDPRWPWEGGAAAAAAEKRGAGRHRQGPAGIRGTRLKVYPLARCQSK
ncbi:uncharacterized protein N7469_011656 [Penicillium citrinum]|uniref:Uncharacterized protein n=1 Tax=Penicillium citrinum TaxID=5077 RepID=A0A9W9TB53_PENCI|nr:uncharacterized protein N7469_011656 [Penicillium citrinum]KAJ5215165.1 hypothetical protein N7469_011656 [Penicillium citrinum]